MLDAFFFNGWTGPLRILVVGVLSYAALIALLRLTGKRTLSKLNAFDLVVTVALGSTLATVLLSKDVALSEGVLAFAMLAILQWVVSRLSVTTGWFRRLVRAQPRLLVEDGRFRREAMADERVTSDEVDSAIRNAGFARIEDVGAVVLETDGSMSVLPRVQGEATALRSVRL